MNREEAIRAVETGASATAHYATPHPAAHARGRVIAYCDAPQVLIETESGEKVWWRADLCEPERVQAP